MLAKKNHFSKKSMIIHHLILFTLSKLKQCKLASGHLSCHNQLRSC